MSDANKEKVVDVVTEIKTLIIKSCLKEDEVELIIDMLMLSFNRGELGTIGPAQ